MQIHIFSKIFVKMSDEEATKMSGLKIDEGSSKIFKNYLSINLEEKKKPSRKEMKKQQKKDEYEKSLQAMGSKLHNLDKNGTSMAEMKKGED